MDVTREQLFKDDIFETLYPTNESKYLGPLSVNVYEGDSLDLSGKPKLEEYLTKEWDRRVKEQGRLTSGPQFRLSEYRGAQGSLILQLAPSNYRELVGTNGFAFSNHSTFREFVEAGKEEGDPLKYLSGVLALCASMETLDKKYMLMQRSDEVGEYPGAFHTVGGHPNPMNFQSAEETFNPNAIYPDLINLKSAMQQEIKEEMGLTPDQYSLETTGLVRFRFHLKPELIFAGKTHFTSEEVLRLPKKDKWEGVFKAYSREQLEEMLLNEPNIVPSGKAASLFHLYLDQNRLI